MNGIDTCILSYGQTGSGKSYTMLGGYENQFGFMQYSLQSIFAFIQSDYSNEYLVRCNFFEIYNDCINDLLNIHNQNLKIQEKIEVNYKKNQVKIKKLSEEPCISYNQALSLLSLGKYNHFLVGKEGIKASQAHLM